MNGMKGIKSKHRISFEVGIGMEEDEEEEEDEEASSLPLNDHRMRKMSGFYFLFIIGVVTVFPFV